MRRLLTLLVVVAVLAVLGAFGGAWLGVRYGCGAVLGRDDSVVARLIDVDEVCGCAATRSLVKVKNPLELFEAAWWLYGEYERDRPGVTVTSILTGQHHDDVVTVQQVLAAHRACLPGLKDVVPALADEAREQGDEVVEERTETRRDRRATRREAAR